MPRVRTVHSYCAALSAPAILFFAASGLFQLFNLHKEDAATGYRPPIALQLVSDMHKNQTFSISRAPAKTARRGARPRPGDSDDSSPKRSKPLSAGQLLLKWYFAFASAMLIVTVLAGLQMMLRNRRDRLVMSGLFLAGFIVPLVITLAQA